VKIAFNDAAKGDSTKLILVSFQVGLSLYKETLDYQCRVAAAIL
jgi:hypothetical protein